MTLALTSSDVEMALLMAILWLLLAGVRAVLEEEAVGQIRRLSRTLFHRAAQHRSARGEGVIDRRRSAEFGGLHDRPVSQFFFAFRQWWRSIDFREVALVSKARVAWLGGTDPQLARLLPGEMSRGVWTGLVIVVAGVIAALANALLLHEWLSTSWGPAIAYGAGCGAVLIGLDRLCLSLHYEGSRVATWARMIPALLAQFLLAWMITTAVRLYLYRPEIHAYADKEGFDHHIGLTRAVAILQDLSSSIPAARMEEVFLTALIFLLFSAPLLLRSLRLLRPVPVVRLR